MCVRWKYCVAYIIMTSYCIHKTIVLLSLANSIDKMLTFSHSFITFLRNSQHPRGGFGGGPRQFAHLATNYAAVSAIYCLGTEEAYRIVDRFGIFCTYFMCETQFVHNIKLR